MLGTLSFVYLLIFLSSTTEANRDTSANVCYNQEVTTTLVNTTYQAPVTKTVWEFCLTNFPSCPRELKHLVPRVKTEKITQVSNIAACCPGYEKDGKECVPICDPPCSQGICSAPYTCSCAQGYSGAHCQEKGCPGGRWGEGCIMKCFCKNGGKCHAVDGTCYCPKGLTGPLCENKCRNGIFGEKCSRKCKCLSGYSCHHISGECVKCSNDTFGDKCEEACDCSENGTALCSHVDGRCFCESNWFGDNCDLDCPFGFSDGACIPSLENQTCYCPSDLFLCDPHLGCVCPLGQDCGIERKVQDQLRVRFMKATQSSVGVAVLVVFFLVIGMVFFIFVLIYYRRKFIIIQKTISAVENNQISFVRPTQDSAQYPLYFVNYSRSERCPSNLYSPGPCYGGD